MPESPLSCQSLAHLWLNVSWQFDVSFVKSMWRSPECDVWAFSASSPMVKTPPESTEPQDSAEDASCGQESLPVRDTPTPKPDPDAWIQVEKRHRQTKVKLWRIKLYLYFSLSFLTCVSYCAFLPLCVHLSFTAVCLSVSTHRPAVCWWWRACFLLVSPLSSPNRPSLSLLLSTFCFLLFSWPHFLTAFISKFAPLPSLFFTIYFTNYLFL